MDNTNGKRLKGHFMKFAKRAQKIKTSALERYPDKDWRDTAQYRALKGDIADLKDDLRQKHASGTQYAIARTGYRDGIMWLTKYGERELITWHQWKTLPDSKMTLFSSKENATACCDELNTQLGYDAQVVEIKGISTGIETREYISNKNEKGKDGFGRLNSLIKE